MSTTSEKFLPASAETPSNGQRTFLRYFTGILIDLVVLNLFAEYWDKVYVATFTTSRRASGVRQALPKATMPVEHWVLDFFKNKPGKLMTVLKYFFAWLVLFGSKFVILEAIVQLFGKNVHFAGMWHGVVTLIVVVMVMLLVEEIIVRIYRNITD